MIVAALMDGDALVVVKDFHPVAVVLHLYMVAHIAMRDAVIIFVGVQENMADFLNLSPLVIALLVQTGRQRAKDCCSSSRNCWRRVVFRF